MNKEEKKLGVYIHIPFCVSKCLYCDFVSFAGRMDAYEAYRDALLNEIRSCEELSEANISSIFFGGGTPTVFPYLTDILSELSKYSYTPNPEITIEANPGTLTPHILSDLKDAGVNRLSIGLQSRQDKLLHTLGRIHSADMFLESYNNAIKAGFDNINIDLMFSIPSQTIHDWRQTLEYVTGQHPAHISAYSLIIEENTSFGRLFAKGMLDEPDEEADREMYYFLKDYLTKNGYGQYEISNFSRLDKNKNYHCRHNILYWERDAYLGFGVSAHSFYNGVRYSNTTSLDTYLNLGGNRRAIIENETPLSHNDAMEEFMFLGLRMTKGIDIYKFRSVFGVNIFDVYGHTIDNLICEGLLELNNEHLYLTPRGIDVSNRVFVNFLF